MKRVLALGLLTTLAACAAQRDEADVGSVDEARIERAIAGREVRRFEEMVEAVRDAALRLGNAEDDVRVPRFGAPIFEPGSDSVAFYEVNLSPGWAIVTANGPSEVIEFNATGRGPTADLTKGTAGSTRIVRLDTALYVATDPTGHARGQSAETIVRIERNDDGAAVEVPTSADAAMADYSDVRRPPSAEPDPAAWAPSLPFWIVGAQPRVRCQGHLPSYKQLRPQEPPNDSSCASGCGATAWAMISAGAFYLSNPTTPRTQALPPAATPAWWWRRARTTRRGQLVDVAQADGTFCAGDQARPPRGA